MELSLWGRGGRRRGMNLYPYACDDGSYFISGFEEVGGVVGQIGAMGLVDLEALKEFAVQLGEYISEEEARLSKFKVPKVWNKVFEEN